MSYLNYRFFEEFKFLDNLCRDIYGKSTDNKLGVTLYLEDMDKNPYKGPTKVPNWTSDYDKLKRARNIRNEIAHSNNSDTYDLVSQEDIDFVRSFRKRIIDQTDPISLLRKQTMQQAPHYNSSYNQQVHTQESYTPSTPNVTNTGCLCIIATFLIIVACVVAFLL